MNIYLDLFLSFLKIGFFTIGGGLAMLPLIANVALTKGWLSSDVLYDFVAISESTPGPFGINIATFIGYQMGGIPGVLCAVGGLFLPSFIIIFIIFKVSEKFLKNKTVGNAFDALRPAVIGLIFSAFVTISISSFYTDSVTGVKEMNWIGIFLAVILFFLMKKFDKIHPIVFIILSAGIGIGVYSLYNLYL